MTLICCRRTPLCYGRCPASFIVKLALIFVLVQSLVLVLLLYTDTIESSEWLSWQMMTTMIEVAWRKSARRNKEEEEEPRFLAATLQDVYDNEGGCMGLGNLIWQLVSVHCIAKRLNRRPYHNQRCYRKRYKEIEELFPALAQQLHFITQTHNTTVVEYGMANFIYEDPLTNPRLLNATTERYVQITGQFLQNHFYFADYEAEVRELLRFGAPMRERVASVKEEMFRQEKNDSHKFCVHTRRGNFVPRHWETEASFTEPAVKHTISALMRSHVAVSLVLIGDDPAFMRSLNFFGSHIPPSLGRIHFLYKWGLSRGEEICFVAFHCDSLLMTASGSTYAWWMAYLLMARMEEEELGQSCAATAEKDRRGNSRGGLILYNANLIRTPDYYRDNFPTSWIPLKHENGAIQLPAEDDAEWRKTPLKAR